MTKPPSGAEQLIGDDNEQVAVVRELLRLALHNSIRSVPIQLLAAAYIVGLGIYADRVWEAVAVGLLAIATALSRLWITRSAGDPTTLTAVKVKTVTKALEVNAVLAGLMWATSTLGIYPALATTSATAYLLLACGSLAIAAFFMSLAGRAFTILAAFQLGALATAFLMSDGTGAIMVALLLLAFGVTIVRSADAFRKTAAQAIGFSLRADRAIGDLVRAKEAAEAANLSKSQFLATMSHEIRTPMNGVLGSLELLRHSELNPQQYDWVKTAASSGGSLMAILNDVLDHARIEAGKLQLSSAPMSIRELAESVVQLFQANAAAKGIAIELQVDTDGSDRVVGDAQRIKQVLLNLVGNAVKFTELGSVTLRATAKRTEPDQALITFQVSDTGVGMFAETVSRLFQPFFQAEGSRKQGGTGLGLSICHRIVQAMGGEIEVRSRRSIGSTFHLSLSLPVDRSPAPLSKFESGFAAFDSTADLHGFALVVDDNQVNRIVATELLKSLGLTVIEAEDGLQAIRVLEQHQLDFVLMDCEMPVMDGFDATRSIRNREVRLGLPHMPILAVTANAFDEDVARALSAGMDGHLAKPFTRSQLRAAISVCL